MNKKSAIIVFILFFLLIELLAVSPASVVKNLLPTPMWTAINYIGMFQHFAVFAPPRKYNVYLDAVVKFEDGTTVTWNYPRVEKLNFFERMPVIYFRKLFNENARFDHYAMLWPDLARYAANQVRYQTHKEPIEVILIRHRALVPEPTGDPLSSSPTNYAAEPFFTYRVEKVRTDG